MSIFGSLVQRVARAVKSDLKTVEATSHDDVQAFLAAGGVIRHFPEQRYSIAMFPDRGGREGRIWRVATSICHPNDTFSRKIGAQSLVTALAEGNQVLMTTEMIDTFIKYNGWS